MLRVDGTMRTYGQTYQIGKYVKRDMEDRSRWTVEADVETDSSQYKIVTITWRPRKAVYFYIKSHISRFRSRYENQQFRPIRIRHGYCLEGEHGQGYKGCSFREWKNPSIEFDDERHSITAEYHLTREGLSYSDVNMNNPNILTSQKIHLVVSCPIHDDSMQRSMKSSQEWKTRGGHVWCRFPVSRKWTMNCIISTDNGLYWREYDPDLDMKVITNPHATDEEHRNYHLIRKFVAGGQGE